MTKLHPNEQNVISEIEHRRAEKEKNALPKRLRTLRGVINAGRAQTVEAMGQYALVATQCLDEGWMEAHDGERWQSDIGSYLADAMRQSKTTLDQVDNALRCLEARLTAIYAAQIEGEK